MASEGNRIDEGEGLPQPAVVLFPANQLDSSWKHPAGGAGLQNYGNTCFLNAVTQCLVHTPPLTNYLMSGDHLKQCKVYNREKCILCNMHLLLERSLNSAADSFSPQWFINNLQFIGRHLSNGQHEDAHEFLRLSLEKMQKCALVGVDCNDPYTKETTAINQIFGGYLRSQVTCLNCRTRSNTYDPVLDISLDIKNVDSIERAFQMFVAPERLDTDNTYNCEKCKQKVSAMKRFTIHKAPSVLTIQLKRFQYEQDDVFGGGGKIDKFIKYPARLNLRPFMSNKNGPPELYSLFATIQHEGFSCQSGHYVANVRCGQRWYNFNDEVKRRTSMHQCLSESSAYVLFYIKDPSPPAVSPSSPPRFKSQAEQKVMQEQMRPDDLLADVASPTTSDKACLLDTGLAKDSPITDHSPYTKLKKHKKHTHGDHKRKRHRDKYEELTDEKEYDERRKKKQKTQNHRNSNCVEERDGYRSKHEDTRPAGIRPTEHTGAQPNELNLDKRKPISHKRKRVDSESSSEFEWVEKNVPTPTPLKVTKSLPANPRQSWDQLIGQKRSRSGYTTPVKSHSWDGLKTSKVVSQLEKLHEYGAPVSYQMSLAQASQTSLAYSGTISTQPSATSYGSYTPANKRCKRRHVAPT